MNWPGLVAILGDLEGLESSGVDIEGGDSMIGEGDVVGTVYSSSRHFLRLIIHS